MPVAAARSCVSANRDGDIRCRQLAIAAAAWDQLRVTRKMISSTEKATPTMKPIGNKAETPV